MLLDVFTADPTFGATSGAALRTAARTAMLIASEVVWAETSAWFPSKEDAARRLGELRIRLVPLDLPAASVAGVTWRSYRRSGGRRERLIADFLVGAHASVHADRLLTRDHGFYRLRFKGLKIVDPTRT